MKKRLRKLFQLTKPSITNKKIRKGDYVVSTGIMPDKYFTASYFQIGKEYLVAKAYNHKEEIKVVNDMGEVCLFSMEDWKLAENSKLD